jgi:hypothetical protein
MDERGNMTSTGDISVALAPAVARFDRQHADARQQRWMAELEQAMLAQQAQPQQQRQADLPPPAGDSAGQAAAQAIASAGPETAGASATPTRLPAVQRSPAQPQAQSQAQSQAPAQAKNGGTSEAAHAGNAAEAPARQAAPGAQASAPDTMQASAAQAGKAYGGGMAVAGQASVMSAQMGLAPGAASTGAAAAAATEPVPVFTPSEPLVFARGPLAGFAAGAGELASPESGEYVAGADAGIAPGEEYEKQLLHLFHGDDGVQAYIRDAELTGARLRAVAQSLAVELGGSGTRLSGLTVNGRRVSLAADDRQEDEPPATASEAAPLPITLKGTI